MFSYISLASSNASNPDSYLYLDNASTTFKPQCVIDAMNKYYMEVTSNSHRGDYDLMNANDTLIIETRKTVAHFVNCEPNEVIFTSGDTESINLLASAYAKRVLKKGDVIVLSESEHASNLLPWFEVAHETGALIEYVSLDENQMSFLFYKQNKMFYGLY